MTSIVSPLQRSIEGWRSRKPGKRPARDMTLLQVDRGDGSLHGLEAVPAVARVKFEQWTDARLEDFAGRPMTDFAFWDTDLTTLDWVADFPDLWGLDLRRTLVTDLRPLLETAPRFRLQLMACPIDEHSWHEVLPALGKRHLEQDPNFPESAWKICRTLHEAGLPVVTFVDNYGELRLSQPGWHIAKGLLSIPADEVLAALAAHTRIDLPTFVNETRVRRGEQPYTLEQMYPPPKTDTDPPAGPPE